MFTSVWLSFLAGLAAPLTAVCVLPLYPGYLAFLAKQTKAKHSFLLLSGLVVTGVISSLFLIGLLVTYVLSASLTNAIQRISPIAFSILGVVSILLILNVNVGKIFPKVSSPVTKNPLLSSYLFGFFFGAIVLPCNPATLIILFALSTSVSSFLLNLLGFVAFGIGMSIPLFVLSLVSMEKSGVVISFLTRHTRKINIVVGVVMLLISLYYLFFVFL
jgi:cytochrome c-type biogenesis protein